MSTLTAQEIYAQHIRLLPPAEQLRLVEIIVKEIASEVPYESRPKRSLLELEGLGAEIWEGIDAQEYVNELRREWDHRP